MVVHMEFRQHKLSINIVVINMKKTAIILALIATLTTVSAQASVTAQAVATWSATAKKDTTSKLSVTPLGSLSFQYAQGVGGFGSQRGLFDVAIEGEPQTTAFKLTSRLLANTLTQLNGSGSTLDVGVSYLGTYLSKGSNTVMIDTASGILGGNLSPLANGYNTIGRATAQDSFTFSIINGTLDGSTQASDFSQLPEGIWSGDVSVQFDTTWTS